MCPLLRQVVWFSDFDAFVANGTGRFPLPGFAAHVVANRTAKPKPEAKCADGPVPAPIARMGVYLHHLQVYHSVRLVRWPIREDSVRVCALCTTALAVRACA